ADLRLTAGRIAHHEAVAPRVGCEPAARRRGAEVVGDPWIGSADCAEVDRRPELVLGVPWPSGAGDGVSVAADGDPVPEGRSLGGIAPVRGDDAEVDTGRASRPVERPEIGDDECADAATTGDPGARDRDEVRRRVSL